MLSFPLTVKAVNVEKCDFKKSYTSKGELPLCLWPRPIHSCCYMCLFVCFVSVTAFVPWGQLPGEDLRRSPLPPRPLFTPGPRLSSYSLFPRTFVMHPASGPYPPLSSCPVHITYHVSGLSPPFLPVIRMNSNPTKRNPSTNIKPHI